MDFQTAIKTCLSKFAVLMAGPFDPSIGFCKALQLPPQSKLTKREILSCSLGLAGWKDKPYQSSHP
jgi:hypothetical protein